MNWINQAVQKFEKINWMSVYSSCVWAFVYFFLFFPVALLVRIFNKESFATRFDKSKASYRILAQKEFHKEQMEKQF